MGRRCRGGRVGRKIAGNADRGALRPAGGTPASTPGFTIVELLVVMAIILVLAGLILATRGYVHNKGARSRAEAEIAALSAALENYKADNGIYPRDANTDLLTAVTDQNFSTKNPPDPAPSSYNSDPRPSNPDRPIYSNASFALYAQLSGNLNGDRSTVTQKAYFLFKPNMLYPAGGTGTVAEIVDPFGNGYGYSTAKVKYNENPAGNLNHGFNPTYDLWSTSGTDTAVESSYEQQWIKNW